MANFWLDERRDMLAAMKKHFSFYVGQKIDIHSASHQFDVTMRKFWELHPKWNAYMSQTWVITVTKGQAVGSLCFRSGLRGEFSEFLEL